MTNIPAPYRLDFFNELGKHCKLVVTFEGKRATDRDEKWVGAKSEHYKAIYLKGKRISAASFFCPSIVNVIKKGFDQIIVSNYSDPTSMYAMAYMKIHNIPYWIEADGGLIPDSENKVKYLMKRHLIRSASHWFSSGHITTEYFIYYGAKKDEIYEYPFTSLKEEDILPSVPTMEEKVAIRKKLGLSTGKMVISVGQFIYRKGFDVLLKAWKDCPTDAVLYIIGGQPTEEYKILLKEYGFKNVYFEGFKSKSELQEYYKAADLFVFPTREDIWGLVVNEAMAAGLPVITTDRCVAGLELIQDRINGYIVPVGNDKLLSDKINIILKNSRLRSEMSSRSLLFIRNYTIKNMAMTHYRTLSNK